MKPLTALAACVIFLSSCHRYYVPTKMQESPAETLLKLKGEEKHFILRDSIFAYELRDVTWNDGSLTGKLKRIDGLKKSYSKRGTRLHYYYSPQRPDSIVNHEVHIFTSHALTYGIEPEVTIPFTAIKYFEELNFDKDKTTRKKLAIGVAAGLGATFVVLVLEGLKEISELPGIAPY